MDFVHGTDLQMSLIKNINAVRILLLSDSGMEMWIYWVLMQQRFFFLFEVWFKCKPVCFIKAFLFCLRSASDIFSSILMFLSQDMITSSPGWHPESLNMKSKQTLFTFFIHISGVFAWNSLFKWKKKYQNL